MNLANVAILADLIEALPHSRTPTAEKFCMSDFTDGCGSPSCMAGWAAWLDNDRKPLSPRTSYAELIDRACSFLGIPPELRTIAEDELFRGAYAPDESVNITPTKAARVLRRFALSGKVNYGRV